MPELTSDISKVTMKNRIECTKVSIQVERAWL